MSAMGESVVRMANAIARNFEVIGHEAAVIATADHIAKFWDSRMRKAAIDRLREDERSFSKVARRALHSLFSDQAQPIEEGPAAPDPVDEAGRTGVN